MDHASGIMYAFSAGRHDISGGTAPIEDPARLESRDQVLSFSGLMGMEDWIHRHGRPRVVPLAWDNSLLLIRIKHVHKLTTLLPKDYYLIPGNGTIKLVE